jgi:hypothetical protein
MVSETTDMLAKQQEVYETIGTTFDNLNSRMDAYINRIDHAKSIMTNYLNIVDLIGKKHLGMTNDMLAE